MVLKYYEQEFIDIVLTCPAVVVCRCSPTQKAQVVHLLKKYAKGRICAIGDGGNDVSMIQAAHVGVGIQGKVRSSSIKQLINGLACDLNLILYFKGRCSSVTCC